MSTSAAVLLGLCASVCWALANVFVARGTRVVGTFRALLWAQIAGGAVMAALAWRFDQRAVAPSAATAAWLVGAGVVGLGAYVCMFYAMERGRLSIVVPIISAWAVISSAASIGVFHETVRPMQLAGAALVILGVVLVSRHAHRESRVAGSARGAVFAALGAALGFGLLIPSLTRLVPATGRLGAVPAVYAADILLGLPLAAIFGIRLAPPSGRDWTPVLLAALVETAGFACVALTAGRAPLAVVSPLASLASAMTVGYAWVVLKDRPPPVALVGAVLASAGVVVLAL